MENKKNELRKILSIFFEMLKMEYGKLYADQWAHIKPENMIFYWVESLIDYDISEIKKGIEAQKMKDFPPTLPQFRKLCRPDINFAQAYYEAIEGLNSIERGNVYIWSNEAIRTSAMSLKNTLMQMPYNQIRDQWEFTLKKALNKVQNVIQQKESYKLEDNRCQIDKDKIEEYLIKLKEITKSKKIY